MLSSSTSPRQLKVREFDRLTVFARARIRIGNRAYAGHIENISEAGARIVTATPIRDEGPVTLSLPDLPTLHADMRWSNGCAAGVRFRIKLDAQTLHQWESARIRKAA